MVGSQDSAFLQQAAHITKGLYLRPKRTGALLQYLLVSSNMSKSNMLSISQVVRSHCKKIVLVLQIIFSAGTYTRGFMQLPKLTGRLFKFYTAKPAW